jgi:hypothetical protein
MTKEDALKAVEEIRAESDDDEMAHIDEDNLHLEFIAFVAERTDRLGALAKIILSTKDIKFARWCA